MTQVNHESYFRCSTFKYVNVLTRKKKKKYVNVLLTEDEENQLPIL